MSANDLIDTTEMYLKTIYELEEDGVTPLRARIVERLGHSGPTVSQTIARMERDSLVMVRSDRRLDLTPEGRTRVIDVMRKHRLAELLLLHVVGLQRTEIHEEACRWEHVMSIAVEERLQQILGHPETDPFGNPIPGMGKRNPHEVSVEILVRDSANYYGELSRIGEPIQADRPLLEQIEALGLRPGSRVAVRQSGDAFSVCAAPLAETPGAAAEGAGSATPEINAGGECPRGGVILKGSFASHLFIIPE